MQAVLTLLIMGLVLGLVIGIAVRIFAVRTDPRIEKVEGLLPGANCGACGFAGCADFARAVTEGEAEPSDCPVNDPEGTAAISALLGLNGGVRERKVAVVRCGGGSDSTWNACYNGVNDCRSANLVGGGGKGCVHGCLGLGSCARACPFDAIEMRAGLAIVHPEICTGCGKCVAACPRNLIIMASRKSAVHVHCNSPEKGAQCKKVCAVSCIACRKCVKAAGEDQMSMDGMLARVNYDNPPVDPALADVCPTGCLKPATPTNSATSPPIAAAQKPANREHAEDLVNA